MAKHTIKSTDRNSETQAALQQPTRDQKEFALFFELSPLLFTLLKEQITD